MAAHEAEAERLVAAYTAGLDTPTLDAAAKLTIITDTIGTVVIVAGATGSLGSRLVQTLAEQSNVATVVCVSRRSNVPVDKRQAGALSSRSIELSPTAHAKLRVYEADNSKPQLGLAAQEYAWLALYGTHIVHSAWPMSGTRPLRGFEPQLQAMRNLLDLVRDMATRRAEERSGTMAMQGLVNVEVARSYVSA